MCNRKWAILYPHRDDPTIVFFGIKCVCVCVCVCVNNKFKSLWIMSTLFQGADSNGMWRRCPLSRHERLYTWREKIVKYRDKGGVHPRPFQGTGTEGHGDEKRKDTNAVRTDIVLIQSTGNDGDP
jgi:hypothetical protein